MRAEALNVGSNAVRVGARALWGVLLPGILAVHEFGTYTLIIGTVQIVSAIALLGSPNAALSGFASIRLLLVHTVILGAVLGAAAAIVAADTGGIVYLLVAVQVLSLNTLVSAWARGRGRFRELLVAYLGGYGLFAAAAIVALLITPRPGVMLPLWLELIGPAASLLLVVWLVGWAGSTGGDPPDARQDSGSATVRSRLRPVYAIGGLILVDVIIWRRIEIFFLQGSPSGSTGVAVFGLAIQLATTALLLPTAILEAWYPEMSRTWFGDGQRFGEMVREKLRRYRALYAVVAIGAMAAFAAGIPLVYPDYRPWLGIVLIVIGTRLAAGYVGFHSTVLYATGRELALYAPVIAGACVALVAHALLTLPYGLSMLPVAYALTHSVTAAGTLWAYRRRERDVPATRAAAPTVQPASDG